MELTHVTWRPGNTPSVGTVPRPGTATPSWSVERCADVAVGVDPEGGLDVVFKQGYGQVVRAHHPPGEGPFTFDVIVDAPAVDAVIEDWGCRSRLEYDESGRPMVMLVQRHFSNHYAGVVAGEPNTRPAPRPPSSSRP